MKITKRQLRRIINEEWKELGSEYTSAAGGDLLAEAGEKITQGVADYLTVMIDDRGMSFEGAMKVLNEHLPALVREGSMREP